jgi:hypothetical protein
LALLGGLTGLIAVALNMGGRRDDGERTSSPLEEKVGLEDEPPFEQIDHTSQVTGTVGEGSGDLRKFYQGTPRMRNVASTRSSKQLRWRRR